MNTVWCMKADIKQRWIAALRSGVFRQVRNVLKSPEGYCCLGVLEVINRDRFFQTELGIFTLYIDAPLTATDFKQSYGLPEEVFDILATMNDGGKTFNEIADWIEENMR